MLRLTFKSPEKKRTVGRWWLWQLWWLWWFWRWWPTRKLQLLASRWRQKREWWLWHAGGAFRGGWFWCCIELWGPAFVDPSQVFCCSFQKGELMHFYWDWDDIKMQKQSKTYFIFKRIEIEILEMNYAKTPKSWKTQQISMILHATARDSQRSENRWMRRPWVDHAMQLPNQITRTKRSK